MTRRSLLLRCKDLDDNESWRDFFETYWKLIYNLARSQELTDVESREVVQETLIKITKKLPGFQYDPAKGSFRSWLLHTAQWKIKDQLRKRKHQHSSLDAARDETSDTSPLDRIPDPIASDLAAAWDRDYEVQLRELALNNVKKRANAKQFQIFDLYVLQEWPVEKVAETLNISAARVYLAKFRMVEALKKEIQRLERQAI